MMIYMFFKLILRFANAIVSVLPDHQPITWSQGWQPLFSLFAFIGAFGQFTNLPLMTAALLIILGFEVGYWLYVGWRVLLGLVPMLK